MKPFKVVFLTTFLVVSIAAKVAAQEILLPRAYSSQNVGIVYDREVSFPVTLHTNGFHIAVNSGKLKTYYKTSYWGVGLGHLKHPREQKQSEGNTITQGAGSYVFGKQNNLIPVRAYKGWKRYYSGKDRRKGVAIGSSLELGVTAGVLKPYVLLISPGTGDVNRRPEFFRFEENPSGFRDNQRIEGTGGLRRGWNNASIVPGINAKAALHLDWGAFDEFMRGMEAGIMVDVFPTAVPILIEPANNTPLFINFYLALHLGKRK